MKQRHYHGHIEWDDGDRHGTFDFDTPVSGGPVYVAVRDLNTATPDRVIHAGCLTDDADIHQIAGRVGEAPPGVLAQWVPSGGGEAVDMAELQMLFELLVSEKLHKLLSARYAK